MIFGAAAMIAYLAIPVCDILENNNGTIKYEPGCTAEDVKPPKKHTPRFIAAFGWLVFTASATCLFVNYFNFHTRERQYLLLPVAQDKKPCTFVKAMIAFILAAIFLVVAIVFWYIGPLERYADASAYTCSFIMCLVWGLDVVFNHLGTGKDGKISAENKTETEKTTVE